MRLSALLAALPAELAPREIARANPADDPVIRGIAYDSRRVAPGDLFCALRGHLCDGHDFISQALELGAVAIVVEELPAGLALGECPAVVVPDARRALAPISTRFFGEPSSELTLIGVTGTNGKTSTAFLIESILTRAEVRVGLIGTVEIRYAGERQRAVNTTPESLDLQRTLRAMRTRNVEAAVLEVSSHGLELGRVYGCRFAVGAVTNVTQDHLDFHGSMDAYLASKALLFEHYLVPGATAVINVDDPSADTFLAAAEKAGARILRTSRESGREAELALLDADASLSGTRATLRLPSGPLEVFCPLLGDFNLENMLVACGVAVGLGVAPEAIASGITSCPQVPGRVERVAGEVAGAPTILVDYAHTPDAVEKLLRTLRPLTEGRLITVFGCGGDRDRAKRPLMAQAAARLSERVIATSDNPRTEEPRAILRDVEVGLEDLAAVEPARLDATERAYSVVVDRRQAIELALAIARPDDTVVIAGKGHEDYQIIGREHLPFDDRVEARRALEKNVRP